MSVIFDLDRDGDWRVRFRYDPELVDLLKETVPSYARTWSPEGKYWTVYPLYAEDLHSAFKALGVTVVGYTPGGRKRQPPPPPPPPPKPKPSQWALVLFERVGPDRVDSVYRALSRALHPDVGGDTQLMQELNAARQEVAK